MRVSMGSVRAIINKESARQGIKYLLMLMGFVHIQVVIHEIVHMVDGWNPNIAVCYSWLDLHRVGFVLNGTNYTLYQGELLAYGVNVLIGIILVWIFFKEGKSNGSKLSRNKKK